MVPFQLVMSRSSPSSKPYEQASIMTVSTSDIELSADHMPAPRPFSPFSSSSSRRKLRGTFAPIFAG